NAEDQEQGNEDIDVNPTAQCTGESDYETLSDAVHAIDEPERGGEPYQPVGDSERHGPVEPAPRPFSGLQKIENHLVHARHPSLIIPNDGEATLVGGWKVPRVIGDDAAGLLKVE